MSDAHKEHESVIKTPKQLIAAVVAAFLVPIICIVLLVQYVSSGKREGAGSNSMTNEAIAARIQPVSDQGFQFKDVNAPKQLQSGAEVFKAVCSACHATGAAGAPKVGDNAAWGPRIAKGFDTLLTHALHGFNAMPAKGGNPDLDDQEVASAIVYMANQSGAKFKEPEMKPAAAAAPAASATPLPQGAQEASAKGAPQQTQAEKALTPGGNNGSSATAAAGAASQGASVDAGKKLYESVCQGCHAAGVAGAPKFGDKAAWAPRLKQGKDTLYQHALHGFQGKSGVMPPKGGSNASDADVKAAVDYMAAAAK